MNPDFIETRRKLLEHFIKDLSKNVYLLISEEFHKSGIANRHVNYYQIAQKYNKVFEQFVFHVRTPETEQEILELTAFFNQGKAAIDKLEHQCLQNQQLFKQIDNGTNKLMENIKELNGIYGEKTIEVELRQAAEDPYVDLLN